MKRLVWCSGLCRLLFFYTFISLGKVSLGLISPRPPLQVEPFPPVGVMVGESAVVDLYGQSFETDITINMVMNSSGDLGLEAPFPVEGVYRSMLIVDDVLYMGSIHDGLKVIDISTDNSPRLRYEYHEGKKITGILEKTVTCIWPWDSSVSP